MAPRRKEQADQREISKRQRLLHHSPLEVLLAGAESKTARNEEIVRAYLEHGYRLAEIGRAVGLHYATVSRIIKAVDK